jgi:hypothetical protein
MASSDSDICIERIDMSIRRFFSLLKYHPSCILGFHVPVRIDYPGGLYEICCQNCTKQMKPEEWKRYFSKQKGHL